MNAPRLDDPRSDVIELDPPSEDLAVPMGEDPGLIGLLADDSGMSTVEYAIGTIAAAAFGAVLYMVVTGDSVVSALTGLIARALNTGVG